MGLNICNSCSCWVDDREFKLAPLFNVWYVKEDTEYSIKLYHIPRELSEHQESY